MLRALTDHLCHARIVKVRYSLLLLLMINSYLPKQKTKYRITLEMNVNQDFNPYEINWRKLFDLDKSETVKSYIEDWSLDR